MSQWTSYDLLTIVFLSYSAFSSVEILSFIHSVLNIVVIGFVYLIVARLSLIQPISQMIIGEPIILIKHGKVIKKNLKRSLYSLSELLSSIRSEGNPDIKDIDYALLEPNGKISIIISQDVSPVTPKHLNISTKYKGLPLSMVIQGKVQHNNLSLINKDELWLKQELESKGITSIKSIFYAYVNDQNNSLTVDMGKDN
ncbi:DUF421 domain-containing protein [Aquibacillus rhizosphaerae]|uniref:DUF421 domain-containing protein n=1 Tax=Aquibacillus rhizosphaerae TaxID=3051431 RepID=A0ABT7L6W5_9BACI|nr:DUF421 domain-containing protein [Aquibacillus sp. LR5S19]MDL4841604.1 DUF421 domain-containing protein [Aquibacillus sp. LR5S19]